MAEAEEVGTAPEAIEAEGAQNNGPTGDAVDQTNLDADSSNASEPKGEGEQEGEGQTGQSELSDFDLPEGIEVDQAMLDEATNVFKEAGVSQEHSQKLVDLYAKKVQELQDGQVEQFSQTVKEWRDNATKDSEFGGEQFDENIATAHKAIEKFGTPELNEMLNDYGVGNHPEMIRFMWNVGKLVKEDVPGGNTAASTPAKDRVELLYPTK
jgi:hypothetical protein